MHYFLLFRNSFFYIINNTKFENYLQSCFEILFVLSKFEIIIIHCYERSKHYKWACKYFLLTQVNGLGQDYSHKLPIIWVVSFVITKGVLVQKKLNVSVISINAVHSFVPELMWSREGWWSSTYEYRGNEDICLEFIIFLNKNNIRCWICKKNKNKKKNTKWIKVKVVKKHSTWTSEGGNKLKCACGTNQLYTRATNSSMWNNILT